jgi:hypothetical protein
MEVNSVLDSEQRAFKLMIYMDQTDYMLVVAVTRDTKAT